MNKQKRKAELKDLNTEDIRRAFKAHLMSKCRRLRKKGFTDREILDDILDYRRRIAKEYKGAADFLESLLTDYPLNPIKEIQELSVDDSLHGEKEQLIEHIRCVLTTNPIFQYREGFNEFLEQFQGLADQAGGELNISWFRLSLEKALSAKQEKVEYEIEWQVLDDFISEIKKNGFDAIPSNQSGVLSPLEKVQEVERVRSRKGVGSYDEAIDIVEAETGERPFKNYNSFKTVRNRWEDYL